MKAIPKKKADKLLKSLGKIEPKLRNLLLSMKDSKIDGIQTRIDGFDIDIKKVCLNKKQKTDEG